MEGTGCVLYGRCPFSICRGCSLNNLGGKKKDTYQNRVGRKLIRLLKRIHTAQQRHAC